MGTSERNGASPIETGIAAGTIDAELIVPGVPTPTVPAAAAALGVTEAEILKSLLFVAPDGSVVLAIASGPTRVDRERLATATGLERLKLASPDLVLERTGYPAGGVAPVAHRTSFPVVIDRGVLELDVAYAGGGTDAAMLRIRPREILRLTGAIVADIAQ